MQNFPKKNLKNKFSQTLLFLFIVALSPLALNAQNFSDLYARLDPSVVTIITGETIFSNNDSSVGSGLGSGVIINDQGMIMTAAHVVASAERIMVKTHDNKVIQAEVISSVAAADVALIKLLTVPADLSPATLGNSDAVRTGDQVLVIGAPFGLEHSLSTGHISGKQKRGIILMGQEMEFLQTDAAINTGNSGGPIFNDNGEVIGIVSSILSKSGGFEGIGFAASINPAKQILLEGSSFWTGFEGFFLNEELARIFNVPAKGGVLIQRVVSNSVADKAGLKGGQLKATILGTEIWVGGDIIICVGEVFCDSKHSLKNIKEDMKNFSDSENFQMTVLRGGKKVILNMSYK